eukprot:m.145646 g.145646  ORF g.145646 m.145646 type:complete len:346 (+) comp38430_c0_seq14:1056-2093(+)
MSTFHVKRQWNDAALQLKIKTVERWAFLHWRHQWKVCEVDRRNCELVNSNKIDCFRLWKSLKRWRQYVQERVYLKVSLRIQASKNQVSMMKKTLHVWLKKARHVIAVKQTQTRRQYRCAERAYFQWRELVFARRLNELLQLKLEARLHECKFQSLVKWRKRLYLKQKLPVLKKMLKLNLTRKFFNIWGTFIAEQKSLKTQFAAIQLLRRKHVFQKWRRRLFEETQVRRFLTLKSVRVGRKVVNNWKDHVSTLKQGSNFRNRLKTKTLEHCFSDWKLKMKMRKFNEAIKTKTQYSSYNLNRLCFRSTINSSFPFTSRNGKGWLPLEAQWLTPSIQLLSFISVESSF